MNERIRLLVVDDEAMFVETMERIFRREGMQVRTAADGISALRLLAEEPIDVVLADISMPGGIDGMELLRRLRAEPDPPGVVMLTAHATVETAVEALKQGAHDYLQKPAEVPEVERVIRRAYEHVRLARENRRLRRQLQRHEPHRTLVGRSAQIERVRELVARVAPSDSTVLVTGESGVGKEIVARELHARSRRSDGPFLTLNCGALQVSLLENELFGHAAGAYTGALRAMPGMFEAAEGGTLLIDEIGEMDLEIQKAFLRVLESGEFRRIGETRIRHADTRIVAATNRDLTADVESGRFRKDLFYRLNVFRIEVPPLRAHLEDLPLLIEHFLRQLDPEREPPRAFDDRAVEALRRHDWPGNVRELKNVVERGLIMAHEDTIRLEHLSPMAAANGPAATSEPDTGELLPLDELQRRHILRALEQAAGNKTEAARLLGVSLRSLYTKLDRHGIAR